MQAGFLKQFKKRQERAKKARLETVPQKNKSPKIKRISPNPTHAQPTLLSGEDAWESDSISDFLPTTRRSTDAIDYIFNSLKTTKSTFTQTSTLECALKTLSREPSPDSPFVAPEARFSKIKWNSFVHEIEKKRDPPAPIDNAELAVEDSMSALQRQRLAERNERRKQRRLVEDEGGGVLFPDALELEILGFGQSSQLDRTSSNFWPRFSHQLGRSNSCESSPQT
jgi:hypothetical protein